MVTTNIRPNALLLLSFRVFWVNENNRIPNMNFKRAIRLGGFSSTGPIIK